MDMAEKDESEGRCPACRTPYDKEKIVGMAANCERFSFILLLFLALKGISTFVQVIFTIIFIFVPPFFYIYSQQIGG